jgi:hypothetical protein
MYQMVICLIASLQCVNSIVVSNEKTMITNDLIREIFRSILKCFSSVANRTLHADNFDTIKVEPDYKSDRIKVPKRYLPSVMMANWNAEWFRRGNRLACLLGTTFLPRKRNTTLTNEVFIR